MVVVLGILAAIAVIIKLEVPSLLKKGLMKELRVFSFLLLFGAGISIAQSLNVKLPNPLDWITFIYRPVSRFIEGVLQ